MLASSTDAQILLLFCESDIWHVRAAETGTPNVESEQRQSVHVNEPASILR